MARKGNKERKGISMAKLQYDTLIKTVATLSGLTKKECKAVIDDYIYVLKNALMNGMEIELKGLGYFKLRYCPPKEPMYLPNVRLGGEKAWTSPKAEYNYPMFVMYKSFTKRVRELTEGNAFDTRGKRNKETPDMKADEYEKFAQRLEEYKFESEEFDDLEYDMHPVVERVGEPKC